MLFRMNRKFLTFALALTLINMSFNGRDSFSAIERFEKDALPQGCVTTDICPGLTIYSLLPPNANHGYKIELFDVSIAIEPHFHLLQTQFLVVLEGKGKFDNGSEKVDLTAGEFITIPPGAVHDIQPEGEVRFLAVDIPGFDFPNDTVFEKSQFAGTASQFFPFAFKKDQAGNHVQVDTLTKLAAAQVPSQLPTAIEDHSVQSKTETAGYVTYALAKVSQQWNIAILDIVDLAGASVELEHLLVLNGELKVELPGVVHHLTAGQSIHIPQGVVRHLTSNHSTPVRVLQMNFAQ